MRDWKINEYGYLKDGDHHSLHRKIAFHKIYRKNRKKYPMRFREYEVHHVNLNKLDNYVRNLMIVTREEHEQLHNELQAAGIFTNKHYKKARRVHGRGFLSKRHQERILYGERYAGTDILMPETIPEIEPILTDSKVEIVDTIPLREEHIVETKKPEIIVMNTAEDTDEPVWKFRDDDFVWKPRPNSRYWKALAREKIRKYREYEKRLYCLV